MSHEVLASQLNDVQVAISEVLSVSEQGGKHAVRMRCCEREHERPVQEPAGLVKHAHGALSESCSNHVLNLADRGQLRALTRLLKLDLAGEQTPEDLRDELVVGVSLCAKDFLQDEQVVMCVLVLLALEE